MKGASRSLEEIVCDAAERHERDAELVREVCAREGVLTVVKTVARLVATRAPRHGEALLFLAAGREISTLIAGILDDPDLRASIESLLENPSFHDRRLGIWSLRTLPIASAPRLLARAAERMLAEGDVIALADVLSTIDLPEIVAKLLASDDWLLRWTLLPWTNHNTDSPLAASARAKLAADPNPLVAGEALQHVAILERANKDEGEDGASFFVLSNHGPARSFGSATRDFLEGWPSEKASYTLDELRAFIARGSF